jgi:large subunit ribosomal protein L21
VYAIVRCGGRQEKAAVDDVLTVDTLPGEVGSSVTLPAVLVVDGSKVVSDPAEVGRYQVTAEIMGAIAGPKINMIQYRNKTGYRRRLGHRQHYTQVRITGISADGSAPAKRGAARSTAKADAGTAATPKAPAEKVPAAKAPAGRAPAARSGAAKGKPAAAGKKD